MSKPSSPPSGWLEKASITAFVSIALLLLMGASVVYAMTLGDLDFVKDFTMISLGAVIAYYLPTRKNKLNHE